MPGQLRWPILRPYATWSQPATALGELWDTGLGYPAARFHPEGGEVRGVLVGLVPQSVGDVIELLDRIEEEGVLYRRVEVKTSGGRAISYEWLGPTDRMRRLPLGWESPRSRSGRDAGERGSG